MIKIFIILRHDNEFNITTPCGIGFKHRDDAVRHIYERTPNIEQQTFKDYLDTKTNTLYTIEEVLILK